jgi:hypothetical protein
MIVPCVIGEHRVAFMRLPPMGKLRLCDLGT